MEPSSANVTGRPPRNLRMPLLALAVVAIVLGSTFSLYYSQASQNAAILSEVASLRQEIAEENASSAAMSQQVSYLSQQVMLLQQEVQLLEGLSAPLVLELVTTINATVIRSGEAVDVQAIVNNTSDVNFTATTDYYSYGDITAWGLYSVGPCGSNLPLEMALFRGHYDGSNLTLAGDPLQTTPFVGTTCPNPIFGRPNYVVFMPHSDNVLYNGAPGEQFAIAIALRSTPCMLTDVFAACGPEVGVSGYYTGWAMTPYNVSNTFHSFEPGSYTVAVGDFWGHLKFLYFQVVA